MQLVVLRWTDRCSDASSWGMWAWCHRKREPLEKKELNYILWINSRNDPQWGRYWRWIKKLEWSQFSVSSLCELTYCKRRVVSGIHQNPLWFPWDQIDRRFAGKGIFGSARPGHSQKFVDVTVVLRIGDMWIQSESTARNSHQGRREISNCRDLLLGWGQWPTCRIKKMRQTRSSHQRWGRTQIKETLGHRSDPLSRGISVRQCMVHGIMIHTIRRSHALILVRRVDEPLPMVEAQSRSILMFRHTVASFRKPPSNKIPINAPNRDPDRWPSCDSRPSGTKK